MRVSTKGSGPGVPDLWVDTDTLRVILHGEGDEVAEVQIIDVGGELAVVMAGDVEGGPDARGHFRATVIPTPKGPRP